MKPLVMVRWLDAQDHDSTWTDEKDAEAFGTTDCEVVSIGFQISKGPKYLVLAGDWDQADQDYGTTRKIPVGCIVSVTPLALEPEKS